MNWKQRRFRPGKRAGRAAMAVLAAGIMALCPMTGTGAAEAAANDLEIYGGGGGGGGGDGASGTGGGGGGGGGGYVSLGTNVYFFGGGGDGSVDGSAGGGSVGGGGGGNSSGTGGYGGGFGVTGGGGGIADGGGGDGYRSVTSGHSEASDSSGTAASTKGTLPNGWSYAVSEGKPGDDPSSGNGGDGGNGGNATVGTTGSKSVILNSLTVASGKNGDDGGSGGGVGGSSGIGGYGGSVEFTVKGNLAAPTITLKKHDGALTVDVGTLNVIEDTIITVDGTNAVKISDVKTNVVIASPVSPSTDVKFTTVNVAPGKKLTIKNTNGKLAIGTFNIAGKEDDGLPVVWDKDENIFINEINYITESSKHGGCLNTGVGVMGLAVLAAISFARRRRRA